MFRVFTIFLFAGGSIGDVSVTWSVDTARSTAVYGVDYLADGATLTFIPGETRKCKIHALHSSSLNSALCIKVTGYFFKGNNSYMDIITSFLIGGYT